MTIVRKYKRVTRPRFCCCWFILGLLLYVNVSNSHIEASIFDAPLLQVAGIFGGGWKPDNAHGGQNSNRQSSTSGRTNVLPPPPPPPLPSDNIEAATQIPQQPLNQANGGRPIDHIVGALNRSSDRIVYSSEHELQQQNDLINDISFMPNPVPEVYTPGSVYQTQPTIGGPPQASSNEKSTQRQWMNEMQQQQLQQQDYSQYNPPSTVYDSQYDQSNQQYNAYAAEYPHNEAQYILQTLQQDLDMTIQRENDLLRQLDNLTATLSTLDQRDKIHILQLDVLTERVMDVEAQKAQEYNELLELRTNCTEQALEIAMLEGTVDEWRLKCSELLEVHEKDKEKIQELKKKVKQSATKAEELAFLVEQHRLLDDEGEMKEQIKLKHQKKKSKGFFAWLFGWDKGGDVEDDKTKLYETARSTLVSALQTERRSVHELEAAVALLEQNNTAIAEQIISRNQIVDELNDRIAVFEEDKVVLKAALRQLQKEIKDETPKTQKVMDDLVLAQSEIERLKSELIELVKSHEIEIEKLKRKILKKETKIQAIESNLTVIGLYVDKLEERLADYTMTRRDFDQQSEKYKLSKQQVIEIKNERDLYKGKVEEMGREHEELKKLLDLVAKERTRLLKQNNEGLAEIDALRKSENALRKAYAKLSVDSKSLEQEKLSLEKQCDQYARDSNSTFTIQAELRELYNNATKEATYLHSKLRILKSEQKQVEDNLRHVARERIELEKEISNLKAAIEKSHEQVQQARIAAQKAEEARQMEIDQRKAEVARFTKEFVGLAEEAKKAEESWRVEKAKIMEVAMQTDGRRKTDQELQKAEQLRRLEEATNALEEAKKLNDVRKIEEENMAAEKARISEEIRMFQQAKQAFEQEKMMEQSRLAEEARQLEESKKIEQSKIAEEMRRLEGLKKMVDAKKAKEIKQLEETINADVERKVAEKLKLAEAAMQEKLKSVEMNKRLNNEKVDAGPNMVSKSNIEQKIVRDARRSDEALLKSRDTKEPPLPPYGEKSKAPPPDSKNNFLPKIDEGKKLGLATNSGAVTDLSKTTHGSHATYRSNGSRNTVTERDASSGSTNSSTPVFPKAPILENHMPSKPTEPESKEPIGPLTAKPIPIAKGPDGILRTSQSGSGSMNATVVKSGVALNRTLAPSKNNQTIPSKNARKVAFRKVRKAFSKATGLHGVFTKSSSSRISSGRQLPDRRHPPTIRPPSVEGARSKVPHDLPKMQKLVATKPELVESFPRLNSTNSSALTNMRTSALIIGTTNSSLSANSTNSSRPFNASLPRNANRTFASVPSNRSVVVPKQATRKVPFRQIRKMFSKATGVHGVFTQSSTKRLSSAKRRKDKSSQGKGIAPITKTQLQQTSPPNVAVPFRRTVTVPKQTLANKDEMRTAAPSKPNVIKHTFGGIQYPDSANSRKR